MLHKRRPTPFVPYHSLIVIGNSGHFVASVGDGY